MLLILLRGCPKSCTWDIKGNLLQRGGGGHKRISYFSIRPSHNHVKIRNASKMSGCHSWIGQSHTIGEPILIFILNKSKINGNLDIYKCETQYSSSLKLEPWQRIWSSQSCYFHPIVKGANSEKSYQWLWQSHKQVVWLIVILNLGKDRGAVQKEAIEFWTAK